MGKVYLLGAGPGDPDLLTLKAHRILGLADVVIYDRLVSVEILALATHATLIDGGKRQGEQEQIQDWINGLMVRYSRESKTVVRHKCGDPMIFARRPEEWEHLSRHGIEVELVPGVSSAIAVPSLAGIPPTFRGVATSFAAVAGHRQNLLTVDWSPYARIDTLIVLMGVENREYIAESLIRAGRDASQPVAFVENGSTPRERVVESTLGAVAAGSVDVNSPAVFVIGEVTRLRNRLKPATQESLSAC